MDLNLSPSRMKQLQTLSAKEQFQSTPPMQGATQERVKHRQHIYISIHALMWGATTPVATMYNAVIISILAPCGERHLAASFVPLSS